MDKATGEMICRREEKVGSFVRHDKTEGMLLDVYVQLDGTCGDLNESLEDS